MSPALNSGLLAVSHRATPDRFVVYMWCVYCSVFSFTVNTSGLVAPVQTVEDFVALLDSVDAGTVSALELVWTTRQEGCRVETEAD